MNPIIYTTLTASVVATLWYFATSYITSRKYKLPPLVEGGVPLLGNALQLPPIGHEAGEVAKGWAEKYGEMYVLQSYL
jgi:hypothetical protein